MAGGGSGVPTEERVRRSVRRTLRNVGVGVVLLVGLGVWISTGFYQIGPNEAAIVLRFGAHARTETEPGLQIRLPTPIESVEKVAAQTLKQEEFGYRVGAAEAETHEELAEARIQTEDNNIVHMGFVVQYRIKDAYRWRYQVEDADALLRDAAQAAVREVVGRTTIDDVLTEARAQVQSESEEQLQDILDRYGAGLEIENVVLQEVQPPEPVRDAFDDVLSALQDKDRLKNEAEGYANEVVPQARAEAAEVKAQAAAYQEAKIAEATGEAGRFLALVAEYRRAPEVTRQRLYLETMEQVLPDVEKVIIEPGTSPVLPYLPLGRDGRRPAGRGER